jgi:hypothetical protein
MSNLDRVIEQYAGFIGQINDRATVFTMKVEEENYAMYFLPDDIEEIQSEFTEMLTYLSEKENEIAMKSNNHVPTDVILPATDATTGGAVDTQEN